MASLVPSFRRWLYTLVLVVVGVGLLLAGGLADSTSLAVAGAVVAGVGGVGVLIYGESTASELTRVPLRRRWRTPR